MTDRPSPARSAPLDEIVARLRAGERLILDMPRQHGRSAALAKIAADLGGGLAGAVAGAVSGAVGAASDADRRVAEAHARRNEVVPKPFPRA